MEKPHDDYKLVLTAKCDNAFFVYKIKLRALEHGRQAPNELLVGKEDGDAWTQSKKDDYAKAMKNFDKRIRQYNDGWKLSPKDRPCHSASSVGTQRQNNETRWQGSSEMKQHLLWPDGLISSGY